MLKYIGTLLVLAIILAQGRTESLNCGDTDAATCKAKFAEKLDLKITSEMMKTYNELLTLSFNYYTEFLKDLPKDDVLAAPLQEHLNTFESAITKLNKNNDIETFKTIVKEIGEDFDPDLRDLVTDDDLRKSYENLLEKHDFDEYRSNGQDRMKKGYKKLTQDWNELFIQLRSTDLETYSEYKEIDSKLKLHIFGSVLEELLDFLNLPLLKSVREQIKKTNKA